MKSVGGVKFGKLSVNETLNCMKIRGWDIKIVGMKFRKLENPKNILALSIIDTTQQLPIFELDTAIMLKCCPYEANFTILSFLYSTFSSFWL